MRRLVVAVALSLPCFAFACGARPRYVEAPLLSASDALALQDAGSSPLATPLVAGTREPPKQAHPIPFRGGEAWSGSLICAQGRSTLTLRVVGVSGDEVRAVVDFTRVTSGVTGRFSAVGEYDAATRRLRLEGEDWIAQPPGEAMLDLEGVVTSDGTLFNGRAIGPGCGFFHVRR